MTLTEAETEVGKSILYGVLILLSGWACFGTLLAIDITRWVVS
jgi:hypothetical protein